MNNPTDPGLQINLKGEEFEFLINFYQLLTFHFAELADKTNTRVGS